MRTLPCIKADVGSNAGHLRPADKVVAASTQWLHDIAGEYVGKDDPVAIVRT